ncbi:MAG: hypothetical protein KC800_15575 [Candidatus Eremiobacteraeota bacterium]|nr:hypothetical protein [Candidatus Eremiobacteraeota bacterium]
MNFNPFRDVRTEPRVLFKQEMGMTPEQVGNPESKEKIPFSGSELTHQQYNDVFEGDSWSIPTSNGHVTTSFRPMEFQSNGDGSAEMTVKTKEGWFGTRFLAKRGHAHFVTGGGDDVVRHEGNSQSNVSVVEAGSGRKTIIQNLGKADDKSVLYLDNTTGTIIVNGGEDNDELHIHHRNEGLSYALIQDPAELPNPNDGYPGLRIITQGVEKIFQYRDYRENN